MQASQKPSLNLTWFDIIICCNSTPGINWWQSFSNVWLIIKFYVSQRKIRNIMKLWTGSVGQFLYIYIYIFHICFPQLCLESAGEIWYLILFEIFIGNMGSLKSRTWECRWCYTQILNCCTISFFSVVFVLFFSSFLFWPTIILLNTKVCLD